MMQQNQIFKKAFLKEFYWALPSNTPNSKVKLTPLKETRVELLDINIHQSS